MNMKKRVSSSFWFVRTSICAFAATAVGSALAALGPSDYVQNGLVAIYDGFYNAKDAAGVPFHDASATTWANLANGCGDFALPDGSTTIGPSNITLQTATAIAPGCTIARASGNITLEACVKSETASTTGSDKRFLEILNRAGMGYDARNDYHFTVYVLTSGTYGSAKKRYYKCPGENFANYAPFVHSVSWVSANAVQGTIRADGESVGSLAQFYTTPDAVDPPDGNLRIGNSDVSYTYFCIRVYGRGLSDDERNLNAAIDAVRFQGKSCSEVTLPEGYSFDENGNLVGPEVVGQHRVVAAGVATFEAPYSEAATLVNAASLMGTVTFDESAYAADEPHALSFSGFDAMANTKTVFDGGWWNFSAGAFLPTDANGRTVSLEGGAVVTNVETVAVAGTTGTDNKLRLTETSSLYAGSLILGSATTAGQRSSVVVEGGSLLNVSGALEFSAGEKWRGAGEQTGNSLTVSGEGSRLVVGGQTSLGRDRDASDSQYMRFGGNTFTVSGGASATLGALAVDTGASYGGESNRVVFSNSARVTMTSLSFATSGAASGRGGNLLEILDGAVVTNTGTMMFGMDNIRKELGNRIVVSNATFYTKLNNYANRGKSLIWGNGNSFVVSGANAELTIDGDVHGFFKNKGSSFVVENGATLNSPSGFYCYTTASSSNTVLVTTGATMNFPNGVYTVGPSNVGRRDSAFNKLVVESGATVSTASAKNINIYGTGCELTVDDGSINCGGEVRIGYTNSYDTACLARVCGTHPKATVANDLVVKKDSTLRFELPAAGYDASSATSDNPILDVGATAGKGVFIDETSRLELIGAEEMLVAHRKAKVLRSYVLIKANSGGINLPEGQLETLQTQLPDGMTLNIVTSGNGQMLVLRVSPKCGTIIMVR